MSAWTDRAGALTSTLCALHCVICALLPATFAVFGVSSLHSPGLEWLMTGLALLLGAVALLTARRSQRPTLVSGLMMIGMLGLLGARGLELGAHEHIDPPHAALHHDDDHAHRHPVLPREADHNLAERAHDLAGSLLSAEGSMHVVSAGVGVMSGLFLVFGHLLSIRSRSSCLSISCESACS